MSPTCHSCSAARLHSTRLSARGTLPNSAKRRCVLPHASGWGRGLGPGVDARPSMVWVRGACHTALICGGVAQSMFDTATRFNQNLTRWDTGTNTGTNAAGVAIPNYGLVNAGTANWKVRLMPHASGQGGFWDLCGWLVFRIPHSVCATLSACAIVCAEYVQSDCHERLQQTGVQQENADYASILCRFLRRRWCQWRRWRRLVLPPCELLHRRRDDSSLGIPNTRRHADGSSARDADVRKHTLL